MMIRSTSHSRLFAVALASLLGLAPSAMGAPSSAEAPFLDENHAAMAKMMATMTIKPSGDVDRDFVDMMVPHHQGAVDMALSELRYGRNEALRRLAEEIIVTQQEEISAMRRAAGESAPAITPPAPPAMPAGMDMR
jgi:uncharacterized protein (DUF305 family)